MKLLISALAVISLYSSFALAGKEAHGGNGVVCKDKHGHISSVQLMDFYEGRIIYSLDIKTSKEPYKAQYARVAAELDRVVNMNVHSRIFPQIDAMIKLLPTGVRLKPVDDSKDILIPADCSVEQLALFTQNGGIQVVSDYWNKMSQTDRAGLVAHEALYYLQRREAHSADSVRARKVNAFAFAHFPFTPDLKDAAGATVNCSHLNGFGGPEIKLEFELTANADAVVAHFLETPDGFVYGQRLVTMRGLTLSDFTHAPIPNDPTKMIGQFCTSQPIESKFESSQSVHVCVGDQVSNDERVPVATIAFDSVDNMSPPEVISFECFAQQGSKVPQPTR